MILQYYIIAKSGPGAVIIPDGTIYKDRGDEKLFRIRPVHPAYKHWIIKIDGAVAARDLPEYEFKDIDDNHTIEILPQVPTTPGIGFDVGGFDVY